ncbi:MAG: ATP-binding cassette domain-containing protein [Acidobacteria bacterium]|nr:ATP-binding cassette domain-containing protein [Acidobacteriota bacterium]
MIEFRGVTKTYNAGQPAVEDLDLEIGEGEIVALVGTSGCGKTTTLKMVNRMVEPDRGEVRVQGKSVMEMDPISLRRSIGYVIQEIGLFPHWRVAANIEAVPKLLGWEAGRRMERRDALLRMVGLEPSAYASKYPDELSGGQRQRVGFARALAADPSILLMDEPFGALDPITRRRLRAELGSLCRQLKKTVLFVTHDPVEALLLGDRIAVMDAGRLCQVGTPRQIRGQPASELVRELMTIEAPA